MEDWTECSFEDLTYNLKRGPFGGDLKKAFFVEKGYPVYEQYHAINNDFSSNRYFIDDDRYEMLQACNVGPGDYIVSCSGTMGKLARLPDFAEKGIINQALLRIRVNDKIINHNYFQEFFKSSLFQRKILKDSRGSGMQNMAGIKEIKPVKLNLPPLPIQRAIVSKIESLFSSLDSGIADLKKAQEQLKIYRQAVLKKAFEGELTKDWREQQTDLPSAMELLEQIKKDRENLYSQKIADWELKLKEWKLSRENRKKPTKPKNLVSYPPIDQSADLPLFNLGELVFQISKKLMPSEAPNQKFIGMDCIEKDSLKPHFTYKFKEFKSAGNWFNLNHVLYGRLRPYLNKVYCAEYEGVASGEFIILETIKLLNPNYLKLLLHQQDFVHWSNEQSSGDKPRVKFHQIALYPVMVPSIPEQLKIVKEIESRLTISDKVEESIKDSLDKAKALRQSILKKAFEGKLLIDTELEQCKQDADYEPASVLLERIKKEKTK